MNKRRLIYAGVVMMLLSAFLFLMITGSRKIATSVSAQPRRPLPKVLIDAGHGGEDGGAVGVGGVIEKEINLSISASVADFLTLCGFDVTMTRGDDSDLSSEGESIKTRKYSDMTNRLKLYNADNTAVVSIHQNQFTDSSAHGTQVFYSPNHADSERLAQCIRGSVTALLQPENDREIKKAGKSIYLLKNAENPAVIVECGFISNPEECALLCDSDYQQQMSFAVSTGFLDYINSM